MKNVHFTLQGKGGVGKSFVSSLLAQFYKSKDLPLVCVDTDPINATLIGYKSLAARRLDLMAGETSVDERKFDELMEWIVAEDSNFVVDNGAASFIALSNYLVENDAIRVIADAGKQVVVHTVITGGQAMQETLRGFQQLAKQLPEQAQLIVWLNEYFGEIRGAGGDGEVRDFEDMKVYQTYRDRVTGLIRIPKQSSATFGKDVELMLDQHLTFDDIGNVPAFGLMAKQRLKTVQRTIFDQLATVV